MANEDGLFLLEVLVDKVTFKKSPCFSDKDFRTCIKIECPAVQPLEICDDDPGSCIAKSGGPFIKTFNVGKSCLFSLKQADINKAMGSFPIKVTAYKSLPCGCIPAVIVLGEATIDMTKEFIGARNKYLANPTGVSYESLQDKFRLTASDGEAGDVALFLRISCFGKMIITKFQGASGPPSLGAGVGSVEVDRSCNAPREFQTPSAPCVCGASKVAAAKGKGNDCNAPCKNTHIVNQAICPPAVDPFNIQPCVEDPKTKKQDVPCRPGGGAQVAKDCCPSGNKVIFQMPSDSCNMGHKQRAHYHITSDGVGDVARDEPGQLVPITADDYTGVKYDFPNHVFKIRVGKYIEQPGRKSKLEYNFITPAQNIEPTVPVNDTRRTQCLPCPCSRCCSPC